MHYHSSFKIFVRFWLAQIPWLILQSQLVLAKFGNLAFVMCEELWRSWRVLSTSADNTLLNLHNSLDHTHTSPIMANILLKCWSCINSQIPVESLTFILTKFFRFAIIISDCVCCSVLSSKARYPQRSQGRPLQMYQVFMFCELQPCTLKF